MIVRALLLLMVVLLLPEAVVADGAWQKHKVVVRDYLPQARKADLEAMVVALNAVMPKRGPRLLYVSMPETPCNRVRTKSAIAVCEEPVVGDDETTTVLRGHSILKAKIVLTLGTPGPLCEELMHALTDMPDTRYDAVSCEQDTFYPGAYDEQFLKRVYKKYGRHR